MVTQLNDKNQPIGDQSSSTPMTKPVQTSVTRRRKLRYVDVLLAIGGVCFAICCCGAYYIRSQSHMRTTDPAEIAAIRKAIVEIELPPHLQPSYGLCLNSYLGLLPMKMVVYSQESQSSLLLMQMHEPGDNEDQMRLAFHLQAEQQQSSSFQMVSRQSRSIIVDGTQWDFAFDQGTMNHPNGRPTPARMISGIFRSKKMLSAMFPAKMTMGYIRYTIDESIYDEAAVIKIIESIHK